MNPDPPALRLYAMRFFYLFNGIVLSIGAWPALISPGKPWDLIHGVAFSLYAGFSLLMFLGVRLPLTMLPLLLLQLIYKVIWLAIVGLPMWSSGHLDLVYGTLRLFAVVVVLDVVVIPWPFVFANYIRAVKGAK